MSTTQKKPRSHLQVTLMFLAAAVAVLTGLIYGVGPYRRLDAADEIDEISKLAMVFETEGIQGFLKRKNALKESVSERLSKVNETLDYRRAERIAVYLFPEVLSRNDFERSTAEVQWAPLEREIEKSPRSKASREKFEELRADIWNYEIPDRQRPQLSSDAADVIRLYDVMSSP